jgi:hypothetical protein
VRCAFFDGNLHSEFTLEEYFEDAVGSHACSFEASMRVTNGIPIGRSLLLPVDIVICVTPLKAHDGIDSVIALMTSHHCRHKMAFVGLTIDSVIALMTSHHCRHKMAFVGLTDAFNASVCTVRVFRQNCALEDTICSHACSLEANLRVTNDQ